MTPLVSICIPTYDAGNGRVVRCVRSMVETTPLDVGVEVCVADCHGVLRGYTAPMNEAMERATGDYLVAVNDDVLFADGWLDALLAPFAADDPPWCVTPNAAHTDGPQVFHPWFMVWSREGWEALGGLDTRFVMWGSDIDIARRLVDAGHPPVKVHLPNPVRHELNATSNEHPQLSPICFQDLIRFQQKWGVDAEHEKQRLAALAV